MLPSEDKENPLVKKLLEKSATVGGRCHHVMGRHDVVIMGIVVAVSVAVAVAVAVAVVVVVVVVVVAVTSSSSS